MHQIIVTPLGTSAATPTPRKNVSGTLVTLDGRSLLVDCGEGTQHRLQQTAWRSGSLDAVLISHLHGDHCYGLPGLLATLGMQGREAPLTVVGPVGIAKYVSLVFESTYFRTPYDLTVVESTDGVALSGLGYRVEVAPLIHRVPVIGFCIIEDDRPGEFHPDRAAALGIPEGPLFGELQRGRAISLGGREITPESVMSPKRRGRRVVYCSDTIPCEESVDLAAACDLLIHEATYGDELAAEALERGHSTARGAAEIARKAGARRLMLTHFSARYEDPDVLLQQAREVFPETILAVELQPVIVA